MARTNLGAVCSDCDSEEVHGHKHSHHHADQNEVTRVAMASHALLRKNEMI